ncbi:glycosyltransferase [Amnibacterium soli]|uniref:Glycosyltransferase n=1 Tax=Amnibacterium soli TaxID=1282736 RepID=A0ABP8ZE40_9MICO
MVIAAYSPGDGFDRVMASLDSQTLPQDEFETIVVDDGSPDDTFDRLSALAASRPNMRVERIENSGWPSRPRNVGTDLARAPYVLYVDHDDKLYPDALRRLAEYADETGADVVSAKEQQTRSVWWGTMPFRNGNVANAVPGGDIHQLMPMIPHKLYRRAFLAEHGIRFPEGKRQLWEDIFFNVAAWRHAKVVSLLADTPVYLWVLTDKNNSSSYGPGGKEFWNRLDVLLEFIDRTLDGEDFARARQDEFLHQWRGRALKRFSKLCGTADDERPTRSLPRAQSVLERYVPEEQDPLLGVIAWPHTVLVRAGRVDQLGDLWRHEQKVQARFTGSDVRWDGGVLEGRVEARWVGADGRPLRLIERDGRIYRDLPADIAAPLPPRSLDVTDTLDSFVLRVGAHSRTEYVTWDAEVDGTTVWERLAPGVVTPVSRGTFRADPERLAGGRPLVESVWELSGIVHWSDTARSQGVKVKIPAMPALPARRAAVAYTNKAGTLGIDLNGASRNVVGDGGLHGGRAQGTIDAFVLPVPKVQTWGSVRLPVEIRFEPRRGDAHLVAGTLVTDPNHPRLEAGGAVPPGRYLLSFRAEGGVERLGRWSAHVTRRGAVVLHDTHLRPRRSTIPGLQAEARRIAGGVRRRVLRWLGR